MRIAYVHDELLPSTDTDGQQALHTIAALTRRGGRVTLVLPRHHLRAGAGAEALRDYYQVSGDFDVIRLRSTYPGPRALEKAGHAVRAALDPRLRAFDVVHTRNVSGMVALVAARLPVVYETYRPWPTEIKLAAPVFRAAMRDRAFVGGVVHSAYAKAQFVDTGVPGDRLAVVYNGYDPRHFEPALTTAEARAAIGLDAPGPVVAYVGRLAMAKGVDMLLAMARARPDVSWLLVGSEGHGEVETAAAALPNVHVRPWQKVAALPAFLWAADALVLPPSLGPLTRARNTVLPMKLFAYLAAERAILAPRAPDTAELLTHDTNAHLVPPDDVDAAVAGLWALVADPARRERLARGARATADDLTWDARADKILAFVRRRLVARNGG